MEGIMARKDLDEKLAEARGIMERAERMGTEASPIPLTAAGSWLLGEVDRLRKIEDGLENLIEMKKQVHEALLEQAKRETALGYFYGTNGALELSEKATQVMAEVWPLEALLNGE